MLQLLLIYHIQYQCVGNNLLCSKILYILHVSKVKTDENDDYYDDNDDDDDSR